ncbi:NAD(P)/FAD-dependent oxidoreductase [Oribacterium sp. WCC10]|uniref:NAD(P)/FAD-dependent oxidoreductase n=1 Tax=Oribacterium sp. WCC10 TaxID=1855343 RepID=UPI0008ECF605|nr:FAD-dependent oxidoreductase [Oribacterium sp. WCC10]SFG48990.1 Thioredoxin reductase [Oribacterium sp. WCC10]
MNSVDIVIVGGGPAGLAAAVAAKKAGCDSILILERDGELGGILNQCIHNGFGLHTFKEELTGPEYAGRFIQQALDLNIEYKLNTMVMDISPEKVITAMNREDGMFRIQAKAVILAMGCRERPRGALNIPGYRPAGIFSAGTAQRLVNIEGYMPGREVVILGSGDIGLIMARRMTLEGAKVKVVAELMPYSGGLKRNIVQCLDDFGIPLKLSHTVIDIEGREHISAVTIAEVGPDRKPIPGTEERYTCDTLLLSCGLIPENELSQSAGIEMSRITSGPVVNESLETSIPGIFACGNVLHVHDLVDYVSEEAGRAGDNAVKFVKGLLNDSSSGKIIRLNATDGARYTVPSTIDPGRMDDNLTVRFRVGDVYKDSYVSVYYGEERVQHRKRQILAPGEMEQIIVKKEDLLARPELDSITIKIEKSVTVRITC